MKEIKLTQGKVALVDDSDYEWLSKHKWFCQHGYAARNVRLNGARSTKRMHQLIMNPPLGMVVDHIDQNKLNNQRSNLRLCVPRQNFRNKSKQANGNTSKYKGVHVVTRYKQFPNYTWQRSYYKAKITPDRNNTPITKLFPYTPEGELAAAIQYNEWAKEYFGEFACLNSIT